MQRLLLLRADDREIAPSAIEALARSHQGFHDIRLHEPGGAIFEAQYSLGGDSTFMRLNSDGKTISLSGTSDAALQVVLLAQNALDCSLRLIDSDYSFDLLLGKSGNIHELRDAIERAEIR